MAYGTCEVLQILEVDIRIPITAMNLIFHVQQKHIEAFSWEKLAANRIRPVFVRSKQEFLFIFEWSLEFKKSDQNKS